MEPSPIDWSQIRALSLDCYGTLIDWQRGVLAALGPWEARHGRDVLLAGFRALEPDVQTANPRWPYRQIVGEVFRQMAQTLDEPIDGDDVLGFAASVGTWPAYPDTLAALDVLAERFDLFLLTNVDEISIAGTLAQLDAPFSDVFTADQIGSYKPDAANFDYLIARLAQRGISADAVVHVAQSLQADIIPAAAAGLKTVWIDRPSGDRRNWPAAASLPTPDERHESLRALAAHVARQMPLRPA